MPFGQALGVGDEEVVADDLDLVAQRLGDRRVAVPVVLVERVLDRDDRVLVDPGGEQVDHLAGWRRACRGSTSRTCSPSCPPRRTARSWRSRGRWRCPCRGRRVAGLVDGVEDELDRLLVVEVGGEAALVADGGVVAGLLEDALEVVEDLGDHADALGEASSRRRA